ncbi:MAG: hypothetical protein ACFFFG_11835 [Candidatus Thorarchaeota archaeon]
MTLLTKQFGVTYPLEHVFQLIYLSANLFSSFEVQDALAELKLQDPHRYSPEEHKIVLRYFLDLIENLTAERLNLIQNPTDDQCYVLVGFAAGGP